MQESVNQTLTSVSEPIEVVAGSSSVSFDDLEQVHKIGNAHSDSKEKAEKPSKETSKEASKEKAEKPSKESALEKEVETKEAKAESEDASKDKTNEEPSAKTIKVRDGEHELELKSDLPFEVKIDGKIEKVKLQDLLTNFSGAKSLHRNYQQFKTEKNKFESDKKEVDHMLNHVSTLINGNKTQQAIQYLAEAVGLDPIETSNKYNKSIMEQMEQYQALSPEELKAKQLQDELSFYKERDESARTKATQEKTLREVESWIKRVQDQHSIDDKTFIDLHEELSKTGHFTLDQITPDVVAEYHVAIQQSDKAKTLLDSVKSNPETREADVKAMRKILSDPDNKDLSSEDIRHIAQVVFGDKTVDRLNQKINKNINKNSERTVVKNPMSAPLSFDEI